MPFVRFFRILVVFLAALTLGASAASAGSEADYPTRCPFDFRSGMPPGVFCVYDGVALAGDGTVFEDPMLVIWTHVAPKFSAYGRQPSNEADHAVYFGFIAFPDVVIRTRVDATVGDRARVLDYTVGPAGLRIPLSGTAAVEMVGGPSGVEILRLHVHPAIDVSGSSSFASYDGAFVGVLKIDPDMR